MLTERTSVQLRRFRRAIALVSLTLAAAVALSGCTFLPRIGQGGQGSGGQPGTTGFAKTKVTVQPLYVAGDSGGIGTETISVSPSDDGDTQVDFSEDEVNGFGDMTRAASWNAITVTTLLTGAPLDTQYRFAFDGAIDGPSAGALTTVGVLSLYFGDTIDPKTTMTGTINPTGTIGVVGGIPEKVQGAIDGGKIRKILIPAGQRNTENEQGETVDVVKLGAQDDVDVVEVATIYDAYKELTGKALPAPANADAPKLPEVGYDKLKAAGDDALARYSRARAQFQGLDASVQQLGQDFVAQADDSANRAADLQKQGLQAGAFVEAQQAAALMEALYDTYDTVQGLLITGPQAVDAKIAASSTAADEFTAFLDQLGTYRVKNTSDAEALITTYGTAFDAYSLVLSATSQLQSLQANIDNGSFTSFEEAFTALFLPLLYFDFARAQLEYSKALFEVGRDADGGSIAKNADLAGIGDFLRRGADANWAAFESGVIQPNAQSAGVSNDVFRDRLSNIDTEVALSYTAQLAEPQLEAYIGKKNPNSAYAAMGYGVLNYARNANHLEKYYNNGVLDENLNLVGVRSDTILTAALDLGRTQVGRATGVVQSKTKAVPIVATASFEDAGVDREGGVTEKFDAIETYSQGFMLARAVAFLGGYPTEGWSR